jgi:hypothetical protein
VPFVTSRRRLAFTTTATVSLAIAIPLAVGPSAFGQTPSTAAVSHAKGLDFNGTKTVIVYLRGRSTLPASGAARRTAARVAQAPVRNQLAAAGATKVIALSSVDAIIATVSSNEALALTANPNVAKVVPNGVIPGPAPVTSKAAGGIGHPNASPAVVTPPPCGTSADPELDPEALTNIHATPAENGSIDGSGVTVAYMADGIDPTNADFQRNAAYASASSTAGSPVITKVDFSGDGTDAPTEGGEAFIDAGAIGAQGNVTYDLSTYGPVSPVPAGCDIKIVGAAPGADVMGLTVFAENNATTDSDFLQAIDYAVNHGVKVLNQSFGSNDFPATDQDVVVNADDAAVAAGVTVVSSTGDSGITNTIGSPASDPKVISAAASTTYREYEQEGYGGTNVPEANGKFVDNNISGLSSGGFTQLSGATPDLLAPGDLNWTPCTANVTLFTDCVNDNGDPSNLEVSGGTSESSPLIAAAAADVIQGYSSTHGGTDPSPALIKRILMSTAQDVDAPATQGGAGLLDVHAAVQEAESLPGTTGSKTAGSLIKPNQITTRQHAGTSTSKTVTVTNTGSSSEKVSLSTRALTAELGSHSGSFCLQPGKATASCPANTGTFVREFGATQVYQAVHFDVPAATGSEPTRLVFHSAYPFKGQNSVLHVALLEPDGTYASYSEPQGLADFADNEVANPPAGQWTAIFFTSKNDASDGTVGTHGKIRWSANTVGYAPGSTITPKTLTIPAGASKSAKLVLKAPTAAGDVAQSVVVSTPSGDHLISVTQRTEVALNKAGAGHFSGILTGGNGRDATSQNNAYQFNVPKGTASIHTEVSLANDPGDTVIGGLVNPDGQLVSFNSNATTDNFGNPAQTKSLDLYTNAPAAGRWTVLLIFSDPITGRELVEPYRGTISLGVKGITDNLPASKTVKLKRGKARTFTVNIKNNGVSPQAFFLDPRLTKSRVETLPNLDPTSNGKVPLPMDASFDGEPTYVVPPQTSKLIAAVSSTVPVTFSMYTRDSFDPDISPSVHSRGVTGTVGAHSASMTFSEPQITPGVWFLDPSEFGPYGTSQAPSAQAKVSLKAKLQPFDPTVTANRGDYWEAVEGASPTFNPNYVPVGDSTGLRLTVKPTAKVGSVVHGIAYVDALTLESPLNTSANEVVGIPYTYTVK